MNAKEVLEVVEAISNEWRLPLEVVFGAVEHALGEATRRYYEDRHQEVMDVRIRMDRDKGEYNTARVWRVVPDDIDKEDPEAQNPEDSALARYKRNSGFDYRNEPEAEDAMPTVYNAHLHLLQKEAKGKDAQLNVGDFHSEPMDNIKMDRITVQHVRQVIFRRVRSAERAQVLTEYSDQVSKLLSGTVERVTRDGYIVMLRDKVESLLPHSEMSGDERLRPGETVRAILKRIDSEKRGMSPQLVMSRSDDKMLLELFKLEVPEVSERIIEILSVAREPGSRSKIAVKTNDGRIDPVGVCVGMRGARVSAVTGQLNGERVDIILWDDDPNKMVSNALSPAKIESVIKDADKKLLEVVVLPENLAPAVGMRGENVRLASKLMNWEIKIINVDEATERQAEISERIAGNMSEDLEIDVAVAKALVQKGYGSLDEVFAGSAADLQKIKEVDAKTAEHISQKAGELLMVRAMTDQGGGGDLDEAMLALDGMNMSQARALGEHGIKTVEDLAEQSVDELLEVLDVSDEIAANLIMAARKPWLDEAK